MKHTVTITFDDETREAKMERAGRWYTFSEFSMTTNREPVIDHDAEEKIGAGYRIFKAGPVLELSFRGRILSETTT